MDTYLTIRAKNPGQRRHLKGQRAAKEIVAKLRTGRNIPVIEDIKKINEMWGDATSFGRGATS